MKKIIIILVLLFLGVKVFLMPPANKEVKLKLSLIEEEIKRMGYNPKWFIISEKRREWYNGMLPNSAKGSYHLHGKAIDIYVIDIDGDGTFTASDIKIFQDCNNKVERKNPGLAGALGTYTTKDYLSKHMIHIDTRGKSKRYNK